MAVDFEASRELILFNDDFFELIIDLANSLTMFIDLSTVSAKGFTPQVTIALPPMMASQICGT